jgi:hypothetical protein
VGLDRGGFGLDRRRDTFQLRAFFAIVFVAAPGAFFAFGGARGAAFFAFGASRRALRASRNPLCFASGASFFVGGSCRFT